MPMGSFVVCGIENAGPAVERDLPLARPLESVGLHVDVALHFHGEARVLVLDLPPEVPGVDVELLEARIGEGKNLGQKGIEPHEVGEPAFERVTLVPFQSGEARESGYLRGVEPVERCVFDEIEAREGFYFTQIEDGKTEEIRLELVKQIRVGAFLQDASTRNRAGRPA